MEKNYLLKIVVFISVFIGMHSSSLGQNQYYLDFDGSEDYVKYSDDATLGRMDGATDFTIEAWIYPVDGRVAEYDRVLQRYYSFNISMFDENDDGNVEDWYFSYYDTGSSSWKYYNTAGDATLTLDAWNHIAVINNSTDGTLKLYVNGVDVTSGSISSKTLNNHSSDNLYIGQKGNGASYFGGYIDEVRLKKTAENPANLHYHIYDDEYSSDANTAGLFHFNEGSGTDALNEASSSNAITHNGPVWRAWNYKSSHILPLSKNTWDGSSSTDWNTTANWSMDALPTSESYVVVADVTNQPTIASGNTGKCGNIEVDASADIAVTGTLEVGGDFTNNGSFSSTGTIKFNGSEEQAIAAGTYNDLDIDNSTAANCTFSGDVTVSGTLNIAGDITIQNGNTLDCNGAITTTGDCVINNNGAMNVGSTFTQNGMYVETAGLMRFDGSAAQSIPSDSYFNIEIDNSNGVDLNGNVSINGVLTLTDGILTSTSSDLLTITSTAGAVSGGSNTSYVDGPVAKVGSGDFIFPVGDGDKWARIGISNLSGSETFTAEYAKAKPNDNTTISDPLTKVSDNEGWTLDRSGSESADVTLYWEDSKWSGIGSFADLRMAHWNGSSWEAESGTYSNSGSVSLTTSESGSITVTGVSSFSPFSFGTTDNQTNTLPIELISFELLKQNNGVQLNWATASEFNNSGFEIQRSSDVNEWQKIAFVQGAGNSDNIIYYSFIDKNPLANNYYRLKQVDYDGNYEFSTVKYIAYNKLSEISIFPNPTSNSINISGVESDNVLQILLFNNMGKLIKTYSPNTSKINMESYSLGIYYLRIQYINGKDESYSFINLSSI